MKILIGLLIGFLILVYVYNYLKLRKRRRNQPNTVAEFHRQFDSHRKTSNAKRNLSDSNYKKYITKYNSKTDYVSKDDLFL